MTTAADIIKLSLKDIGVLDENETPSAALMADSLATLNQMLAMWALEKAYVYASQTITFSATGAQSYTIGAGGVINVSAPQSIDSAVYTVGSYDYKIDNILNTFEEYLDIPVKSTAGYPDYLYFNPAHPLGTIYIYPVPSTGTIKLASGVIMPNYTASADDLNLPASCELVVRLNLSVLLSSMGLGKLTPGTKDMAGSTLRIYKRSNSQIGELPSWNNSQPYNILINQ